MWVSKDEKKANTCDSAALKGSRMSFISSKNGLVGLVCIYEGTTGGLKFCPILHRCLCNVYVVAAMLQYNKEEEIMTYQEPISHSNQFNIVYSTR